MYKIFSILIFSFALNQGIAQEGRFQVSLLAGLNFSELEGEGIGDYFGLNAGLKSDFKFAEKWRFGAELLYSENAEYILPDFYPQNIDYGKISLKHLEIPFHVDLLLDIFKKNDYVDWQLEFGFTYAKLLDYRAENSFGEPLEDQIIYGKNSGWQHQFGMTYFFSSNFGLNSRISFPIGVTGLTPTLSARLVYII